MCCQYIIVSWTSCVTLRVPLQTIIERFMLNNVCSITYEQNAEVTRSLKYLSMEIYAKINDTIEPTLLSKLTGFYYYGNMAQVTQVWKLTSTPPGPTAKTTVDETNAEKENLFRDKKKWIQSNESMTAWRNIHSSQPSTSIFKTFIGEYKSIKMNLGIENGFFQS